MSHSVPYTFERRPDTGVTNTQMGVWLFLASEVMLFGSLFSAYAILRTGAEQWPVQRQVLHLTLGSLNTVLLVCSSIVIWLAARAAEAGEVTSFRRLAAVAGAMGTAFLGIKGVEYVQVFGTGVGPATNNFLGLYFTMTGLHAAHLAAGIAVVMYLAIAAPRLAARSPRWVASRAAAAAVYWHFVDAVWLCLFVVLYTL